MPGVEAVDQIGKLGIDEVGLDAHRLGQGMSQLRVGADHILVSVVGLERRVGDFHTDLQHTGGRGAGEGGTGAEQASGEQTQSGQGVGGFHHGKLRWLFF
jgi:hypothetical protein